MSTSVKVKALGRSKAERQIKVVELKNGPASAELWSFGARLHSLNVPHEGKSRNIVKSPSDPVGKRSVAGASIGRVANRIRSAQFDFKGKHYHLEVNAGDDHLHGGSHGFHSHNWELIEVREEEATARFYLKIGQRDDGYPGTLEVTVTYRLSEDKLHVEYRAQSSHDTLFAPTLHSYFNLTGERAISDHQLRIPLEYFQVLESGIPKGRPQSVKGWNDLRKPVRISKIMTGSRKEVLDLCWIRDGLPALTEMCELSADNGLSLSVYSSMPSLQVYTGSELKKDGLRAYSGIALEPEYPPDSANRVMVNRIVLHAGEARMESIEYCWKSTSAVKSSGRKANEGNEKG